MNPFKNSMRRFALLTITSAVAAGAATFAARYAHADDTAAKPAVRGDLIADYKSDAADGAKTWTNHVTGDKSIGDLAAINSSVLSVASVDGPFGGAKWSAVKIKDTTSVLKSANALPTAVLGSGSVSVEVWVNVASDIQEHETVVAYGERSNGRQRQFLFGSNKPMSGFFADVDSWGKYTPTADAWHLVDYVYNGDTKIMSIYVDGIKATSQSVDLDTAASPFVVGAGNSEDDHTTWTTDPLNGMIASIRVMTGVLTDDDVANDYVAAGGKRPSTNP